MNGGERSGVVGEVFTTLVVSLISTHEVLAINRAGPVSLTRGRQGRIL